MMITYFENLTQSNQIYSTKWIARSNSNQCSHEVMGDFSARNLYIRERNTKRNIYGKIAKTASSSLSLSIVTWDIKRCGLFLCSWFVTETAQPFYSMMKYVWSTIQVSFNIFHAIHLRTTDNFFICIRVNKKNPSICNV